MYRSKDSQYTLFHNINQSKKLIFLMLSLSCFLLSGCMKAQNTKETIEIDPSAKTPTLSVTATPTPDPTPTVKPSASIINGEEISVVDAQALLEERLDTSKYNVDLLSETIKIDDEQYIAFIGSENAIPLEPILIVNKFSGKISCMSKEGRSIAFSNFPSNKKEETVAYDWNGTFYRRDNYERVVSTLQIVQNDSSFFEFIVQSKDSITNYSLAGIGHIKEDTSVFIDESGKELLFIKEEGLVTLYDNEAFSHNDLSIGGTYYYEANDTLSSLRITLDKAYELVSGLSMIDTKLPAEISEYTLLANDITVIVQDRICYEIGAYAKLEENDILMTTFYVSVDGNVIYAYDNISKNTYATIDLN